MKAKSITLSVVFAALTGCTETPPTPEETPSYVELPERQSSVSGIVYDPEAIFFSLAMWPGPPPDADPNDPQFQSPPPAFFDGIPHTMRAAPMGAHVSMVNGATVVGTSEPVAPNAHWQVLGVPTSDSTVYYARAEPPAEGGVMIGASFAFPSPPFEPIPQGNYYPTTSLRPIVASGSFCQLQVAEMVGDAGGLAAVANLLTDMGTPTTPADLADPAKTGGVTFIWVYSPSPVLDIFNIPSDDNILGEASAGMLVAVGWAPPNVGPPGQSPMGYFAFPAPVSPLGYFALIRPPDLTEPVTVTFTDTKTDPDDGLGPRPWAIPPVTVPPVPGISFVRTHAFPGGEPPQPDPNADPGPQQDLGWMCLPQ